MKNIFYFRNIKAIGGTEQFLYEIAKKYKDWDIVVYYETADKDQLERLTKYIRCEKRVPGEKVKCEKAFFNFNIDMIEDVEAKEYYFISHANYEELGYKPPIDREQLTHYIGVSEFATNKLNEQAKNIGKKIKAQRCYNPLTLEPKEKVLKLVSAGRLDDKVKGGDRTLKLIKALDKYSEKTGRHYLWIIYTNPTNLEIKSPNVVIMKPRIDVRPYIANADYVLQLSNDMETYCYTINEALGYGVPIVTTPLSILKELPITDNEHIVLDWDCSNAEDVARQIFEKKVKSFTYTPPKDSWDKLLAPGKSTYAEDINKYYKVRATAKYEKQFIINRELGRIPKEGEEIIVNKLRLEKLIKNGLVELIGEYNERTTKTNELRNSRQNKANQANENKTRKANKNDKKRK